VVSGQGHPGGSGGGRVGNGGDDAFLTRGGVKELGGREPPFEDFESDDGDDEDDFEGAGEAGGEGGFGGEGCGEGGGGGGGGEVFLGEAAEDDAEEVEEGGVVLGATQEVGPLVEEEGAFVGGVEEGIHGDEGTAEAETEGFLRGGRRRLVVLFLVLVLVLVLVLPLLGVCL